MNPDTNNACAECGMPVSATEYHPFAACLMFKSCHDSSIVRANLIAPVAKRELAEKTNEVARLREALEDIANMREYDQDDAHRLRYKAKMALAIRYLRDELTQLTK